LKFAAAITLALAAIALAWAPTRRGPLKEISLCTPGFQSSALVLLAAEKSYFDQEGLKVNLQFRDTGRDCLALLLGGKVDFAVSFETPVVHATLQGHRLAVLTELHRSEENTAIIFRKDRRIRTGRDLIGKRIGVLPNTTGEFLVELFLRSHMIDQSRVKIRSFTQDELVTALKKGQVDAAGLWEPLITNLRTESPAIFGKFGFSFYTEFSTVVGVRSRLEEQPELGRALLKALALSHWEYRRDTKGSQALVDEFLKEKGYAVYPENWDRVHVHLGLSATLLTMLNEEANWYQSRNKGERLDLSVLLEGRLLREIAPTLVTYQ